MFLAIDLSILCSDVFIPGSQLAKIVQNDWSKRKYSR